MEKITVFLSSDVLFSAAYSNCGLSRAYLLFELQREGCFDLYVSSFICREARHNIAIKCPSKTNLLESLISETTELNDSPVFRGHLLPNRLPDADRLVLSTAIANRIRFFLTGNEPVFSQLYGKRIEATFILSTASLLN
jgi:uncharacterized protein